MIYDCIECLPDSVKAALDENGQKMWMDAFNKTVKKSKTKKSYRDAVFDAWQMVKNYEGCRYFSGMVSTEDLDRQNDVVEVNKAFERIAKHIERGGTMVDTHTNRTVGSFIFVEKVIGKTGKPGVMAHSVIYQGEPYYDSVWDQIKKGQVCPTCRDVRKGFSIGGFALETRNSCDASGCHRDILDMSIHEISICQEPANPEALIQDVNMMAKSETELSGNENVISKDLRADAPAVAQEQPQMQEQVPQEVSAEELKAYAKKLKDMQNTLKYYEKFAEQFDSFMEQAGLGGAKAGMEQQNVTGVAKASATGCGCGAIDENVHTSVGEKSCPVDEKLYGDVKDPQVRDAEVEFLENVDIEADESAKKDHGELMPGKPDLGKKETAKEGPAVETKVMEGFSNLKAVNKTSEKNGEYEYSLDPKDKKETVTDDGDSEEANMGKEGKELLMKEGKMEIPAELMPLFQEFLNEKGIKMEPKVENAEIEDTIEKHLYIDDDISEMDLKNLSDGTAFDFAQIMGKSATQKLKLQSLDAKMKLAKNLKVADIEYLIDDNEVKKFKKLNKIAPLIAAAAGEGAAAGGAMEAAGAANAAKGAKGEKTGGGGGDEEGGVEGGIGASAMGAAQNVLGHAQQVAQKPTQTPEDSPLLSTEQNQKEAQKKLGARDVIPSIVNNYIDSTPKTPGGKMLSGAMQMGRGARKLSKPVPQTPQTQKPANIEEVMGPEDVVKAIKKK